MAAIESDGGSTVILQIPCDVLASIDREAERHGLSRSSYLMLLHAMREGSISEGVLGEVKEIYTQDRPILRELAK